MNPTLGNIVLCLFLAQTICIGLLPLLFECNGLYVCSLGSLSYGLYVFVLPGRMIYRLKPKAPPGSPGENCIRDLLRAWAMFCVALGAMGLSISLQASSATGDTQPLETLQWQANVIFLVVGLVSICWDWHLMRSKHWEAETFLLVTISANVAISIAAGSGLFGAADK